METLIVERKQGVVTVTMNRPEREERRQRRDAERAQVRLRRGGGQSRRPGDGPDRGWRCLLLGADLSDPNGPATDPTRSGLARMCRLATWRWHFTTSPSRRSPKWTASQSGRACRWRSVATSSCAATGPALHDLRQARPVLDNGASWLLPRLVGWPGPRRSPFWGHVERRGGGRHRPGEPGLPVDELDAFVDESGYDARRRAAAGTCR